MGLETGSYVADLNTANPSGADQASTADDHLRLIKTVLKNSLAGFAGLVLATGTEAQGATANDFVVTIAPAPAAYTASMVVLFKATHANSGAATLKVNALTAKTLKDMDGGALASGDIPSGGLVCAFYDGTDFLLLSGNDRAARAGDAYTGTHDFTAATAIEVPTQTPADNSDNAASTAYVDAADDLKANIASPTLTGTPAAPTAAPGTNTTQLATTAFVIQQAFQAALPVQTGASGKFLKSDGTNASWEVNPRTIPAVIAQYQLASGSDAAAYSSGSWQDVPLNTLVRNDGSLASLGSNAVTLPAGEYHFNARATQNSGNNPGSCHTRLRIYDSTNAVVLGQGENVMVYQENLGQPNGAPILASAYASLAGTAAVKLQRYVTANGNAGVALSTGQAEVYATLEIIRKTNP